MLGSKMVKEGFGVAGGDLRVGAEILSRAALADEFAAASGRYFDAHQAHSTGSRALLEPLSACGEVCGLEWNE